MSGMEPMMAAALVSSAVSGLTAAGTSVYSAKEQEKQAKEQRAAIEEAQKREAAEAERIRKEAEGKESAAQQASAQEARKGLARRTENAREATNRELGRRNLLGTPIAAGRLAEFDKTAVQSADALSANLAGIADSNRRTAASQLPALAQRQSTLSLMKAGVQNPNIALADRASQYAADEFGRTLQGDGIWDRLKRARGTKGSATNPGGVRLSQSYKDKTYKAGVSNKADGPVSPSSTYESRLRQFRRS